MRNNKKIKTFKYRIYPSRRQITLLKKTLTLCIQVYNTFLEHRKSVWTNEKRSVTLYEQCNMLPELKRNNANIRNIHSQVLQNIAVRVDLAFKAFFRRLKSNGEKAGFPRFKSVNRYDSFTFPQTGFKLMPDKEVRPGTCLLRISKIGSVKIRYHREIVGRIKTCTIKRTKTDKWFAVFTTEVDKTDKPIDTTKPAIGIDVGIESFATFSNGNSISNPKFAKKEEKALEKSYKKFNNIKKSCIKKNKKRKVIARINERICNRRSDFAHKLSRTIVDSHSIVAIEDLSVNNMIQKSYKNIRKGILDAAWSGFTKYLEYKAEEAGALLIKVNPAYTSQTCSRCGYREHKKLSQRFHNCKCCGLSIHRDHNAAINILTLGLQSLGHTLEARML